MKALCISLGTDRESDPWLTLHHEYLILSVLVAGQGPAKFRVLADDKRTPILVEATLFAAEPQHLPPNWRAAVREGGVLELAPRSWLEHGFWERYFDGNADAVASFQAELQAMIFAAS
jgi:hypothetical protein